MKHLKYALHPGEVTSQNDGNRHYVGAFELARLYQVPMDECLTINPARQFGLRTDKLIHLYPRMDGRYGELAAMERGEKI